MPEFFRLDGITHNIASIWQSRTALQDSGIRGH
jgi:hypothetical protein